MRAIEALLYRVPAWKDKLVFIQVAAPTRSKLDSCVRLQVEAERLARDINARQRCRHGPMILVVSHHEQDEVFKLFKAADACIVSSLHDGMNLVTNRGDIYLDPAIAEKAVNARELALPGESDGGELSRREQDVLRLVAQGFSNKQIAGQLDISVKSVETYKARAGEKKGLLSRADIVRYGIKQGWLAAPN